MSDGEYEEWACERHRLKEIPKPYSRCPYCVEEERIEAAQAERHAKPEHHHPTVDAPRY